MAGAAHTFAGTWSPTLGAALVATLPTGNATCGLGTGQTSWGMDAGVDVAPSEGLRLSASGRHGFSGPGTQSALSAPQATSLAFEAAYTVAPRWIVDGIACRDVGHAHSTQPLAPTVCADVTPARDVA